MVGQYLLFRYRIEVGPNVFVHLEHVNLRLAKDSHHLLVANDLAFVLGILQIVAFDVLPQSLHDLGTR